MCATQHSPCQQCDSDSRRAAGPASHREKGRAADGNQFLLVEQLLEQGVLGTHHWPRRRGLAGVGEPYVEVAPFGVDPAVVGLQLDGDAGVGILETRKPGHQPQFRHGLDRDDSDAPGSAAAVALADGVKVSKDSLDLLQVGSAARLKAYTAMAPFE